MRSSGTPAARAASYEHSSSAAPWSTSMLAHMRFGYGKHTMRLSAETVRISSAVYAVVRPRVRVRRRRPPRSSTTARSRGPGVRRSSGPRRRAARSRTAGTPSSARPRGAPSRTRSTPGRSSPITHSHGASLAVVPREIDARLAPRPPTRVHATRRRRSARRRTRRCWMRVANSSTRSCGLLPPTVDTAVARGSMPSVRARNAPGSA